MDEFQADWNDSICTLLNAYAGRPPNFAYEPKGHDDINMVMSDASDLYVPTWCKMSNRHTKSQIKVRKAGVPARNMRKPLASTLKVSQDGGELPFDYDPIRFASSPEFSRQNSSATFDGLDNPRSMSSPGGITKFGLPEDSAAVLPRVQSRASSSQDPNARSHKDAPASETVNNRCSAHPYPSYSSELSNHLPRYRDPRMTDENSQSPSMQSGDRDIPARESGAADRRSWSPGCAGLSAALCTQQSIRTYSQLLCSGSRQSKKGG